MTQHSLLKKALLLSGVALFAFAAPAQAGFEWKGPLETPQANSAMPEAPAMQAVPAAPVDSQPMTTATPGGSDAMSNLAPVTDTSAMSAAPMPAAAQHNSSAQNNAAPAPTAVPDGWSKDAAAQAAAMPQSHDDAAMPAADTASSSGPVLSGFGSDLPLVIALQQIVPPGYQYSFASGVNPGVSVSWQGGKPWQQVLGDTLEKQNLGYRVQNNTVVIGNFGNARAMDKSGMNDVPAQNAAAAPAAMANNAGKPAAGNDADMPAPLWDTADAGNGAAKTAPANSMAMNNDTAPASMNTAPARTPIISPSTSSSRANQLPADLAGYAANANDGTNNNATGNNAPTAANMTNDNAASVGNDHTAQDMAATSNSMSADAPATDTGSNAAGATGDAAAAGKPQTVVIHRQKPSSLFERLGWAKSPKRDARNQADLQAASMPAAPTAQPAAGDATSSQNTSQPGSTTAANDLALPPPATMPAANNGMGAGERMASAATPTPLSMNDASPAPTPVSAATAGASGGWSGHRGDSLRDVLTAWSSQAGVKLYWAIDYDYRLTDNAAYSGAYDEAVGDLLGKFASVRPQPYGQLHQSADGSRVLVVKSYDLTH